MTSASFSIQHSCQHSQNAGWLAVVGPDHLAVRVALMREALPLTAVEPGAHWPELYPSLDALLAARDEQSGRCG